MHTALLYAWQGVGAVTTALLPAALGIQYGTSEDPTNVYRMVVVGAVATVALWLSWFLTKHKEARAVDAQEKQEMKDVRPRGDAGQTSGDASHVIHAQAVSFNQTGGITARTVQFGNMQRTLGPVPLTTVERLKEYAGTHFTTTNSMDGETVRYEAEIRRLLGAAGWVATGSGSLMQVPAIRGLWIYGPDEPPAAKALIDCLHGLGLQARMMSERSENSVRVKANAAEDKSVEIMVGL